MGPQTRFTRSRIVRIDPGRILLDDEILEEGGRDNDVDMTMDDNEERNEQAQAEVIIDSGGLAEDGSDKERLIVAVDFGTTFSSIAYVELANGVSPEEITLDDIQCIGDYPAYIPPAGIPSDRLDVPTELWYDSEGRQAWPDEMMDMAEDAEASDAEDDDSESSDDNLSVYDDSEFDEGDIIATTELNDQVHELSRIGDQYWGFAVQRELHTRSIPKKDARPLSRFKLLLDEKKQTKKVRTALTEVLKALKRRRFIKRDEDVITHYLIHLLSHAKQKLEDRGLLRDHVSVEFVLCVPAKWPSRGCRIMQSAMESAVKEAGLGVGVNANEGFDLFMISEPEAAAACVLEGAENEVYSGETVVVLDAGGGTVDGVTYRCTNDEPLRLSAEVVAPNSKLCGASYINEKLEDVLSKKLSHETYLVKNGKTIKSIVDAKVGEFEIDAKRKIDTTKNATIAPIYVDDLRENPKKNFRQNLLALTCEETSYIFEKSLKGARSVLHNQLELAKSEGHQVEKVVLTGGFGQSPALQNYLRAYLRDERYYNLAESKIELVIPDHPSTAVARGAVLRALNKAHGPDRITQCSYGYLCSEPYEPDFYDAHKKTKCRINKADGERYVDGTINWVIQAGSKVKNGEEIVRVVKHTFSLAAKKLLCQEELYVSDEARQSHYRKTNPVNKGAERAGFIVVDMTFLKEKGLQPTMPSEFSTFSSTGKRHWAVEFELVMILEGRSLRFEARWPLKDDLVAGEKQQVHAREQVCIAAGFQPGTA